MKRCKLVSLTICFLCWSVFVQPIARAHPTNLYQSVEQALKHSPQLKALVHHHTAIENDLDQSRKRWRPSIDLTLGHGLEQHSDDSTRKAGAEPSDSDWDSKGDASVKLIQKLYDGGETGSRIAIQTALRDSSDHRIQAATQAVALGAIGAHLDVYMQRKLIKLAQKNLNIHQEIYQLLAEREQAGAGDIADVTQTNARLARARSNLSIKEADLSRALANYARVAGTSPGDVAYADAPKEMPDSAEEALRRMEDRNPELLAFNAGLKEVDAQVALARSPYKPRINFEMGSSYKDQLEGSSTWQNTNEAMVLLQWNLYNGGQDRAGVRAALSRKYERLANRNDLLLSLRETTAAAWANYLSLQHQIGSYRAAAKYSRSTFDAYMNQYSISRRSLLDVLNAQSDYHQAASQLVTATVNRTLEAYRILNLGGELKLAHLPRSTADSDELSRLSQAMVFPLADQTVRPERKVKSTPPLGDRPPNFLSIQIGPCVNRIEVELAEKYLEEQQISARRTPGTGKVKFYRLREGVYPQARALKRLNALKNSGHSAFVVRQGEQLALIVGSFHRYSKAKRFKDRLEQKKIDVKIIETEIEMEGTMLMVKQITPNTADAIEKQMQEQGLATKIITNGS